MFFHVIDKVPNHPKGQNKWAKSPIVFPGNDLPKRSPSLKSKFISGNKEMNINILVKLKYV